MRLHLLIYVFSLIYIIECKERALPVTLNSTNWHSLLEGEWLVDFYAPWCPACKNLEPIWQKVAGWSSSLNIKVASVDVTDNPDLSGRFLITALPSIYHVVNGQFRLYTGTREETDIVDFVDEKKWAEVEPIPWYKSPTSYQMACLGKFFQLSMLIRDAHTSMTETYGIPVWGSYLLFALATIATGLVLGLVLVCVCDYVIGGQQPLPPPPPPRRADTSDVPNKTDQRSAAAEDSDDVVLDDRNTADDACAESSVRQRTQPREDSDRLID